MTLQIYGAVEFCCSGEWYDLINVSSILMKHADLNGCLFGVDNYGAYVPLFPDRGLPVDCSIVLVTQAKSVMDEDSHPSWALWSEIKSIDWEERASSHDQRITEYAREGDMERVVTKWLNAPRWDWVRDALDRDPKKTIHTDSRTFRRLVLKRRDCLTDTEFPLLMKLMACMAERFGDEGVRLTVWFGL